jgi:hypothetical protein
MILLSNFDRTNLWGVPVISSMGLRWQALWKLIDSPMVLVKHVQAVYLPGWIVDAEVLTNAWLEGSAQVRWSLLSTAYVRLTL